MQIYKYKNENFVEVEEWIDNKIKEQIYDLNEYEEIVKKIKEIIGSDEFRLYEEDINSIEEIYPLDDIDTSSIEFMHLYNRENGNPTDEVLEAFVDCQEELGDLLSLSTGSKTLNAFIENNKDLIRKYSSDDYDWDDLDESFFIFLQTLNAIVDSMYNYVIIF